MSVVCTNCGADVTAQNTKLYDDPDPCERSVCRCEACDPEPYQDHDTDEDPRDLDAIIMRPSPPYSGSYIKMPGTFVPALDDYDDTDEDMLVWWWR